MPSSELATISPRRDSRSTDKIVRHWIVAIAELCGKELTPALVGLWCQLLADIEPDLLDRALKETAKTCGRFFPTPGEVRERIDQADSNGLELRAAREWDRMLKAADWGQGFKQFDAATRLAASRAGNLYHLDTYKDELFARERFIAAYKLVHETGQVQHLLTDGEAKMILCQLTARSKQPGPKKLAPIAAPPAAGPLAPDDPIRADLATLREKLSRAEPMPVMTDAEFEARRELLKRQSAEILKTAPKVLPAPAAIQSPAEPLAKDDPRSRNNASYELTDPPPSVPECDWRGIEPDKSKHQGAEILKREREKLHERSSELQSQRLAQLAAYPAPNVVHGTPAGHRREFVGVRGQ